MSELLGDTLPWLRNLGALAAVLLLAVGALGLLRRLAGAPLPGARPSRLTVVASHAVDARVRLVLLRRDATEHLLAVTPAGVTVIETLPACEPAPAGSAAPC